MTQTHRTVTSFNVSNDLCHLIIESSLCELLSIIALVCCVEQCVAVEGKCVRVAERQLRHLHETIIYALVNLHLEVPVFCGVCHRKCEESLSVAGSRKLVLCCACGNVNLAVEENPTISGAGHISFFCSIHTIDAPRLPVTARGTASIVTCNQRIIGGSHSTRSLEDNPSTVG